MHIRCIILDIRRDGACAACLRLPPAELTVWGCTGRLPDHSVVFAGAYSFFIGYHILRESGPEGEPAPKSDVVLWHSTSYRNPPHHAKTTT
jgi:hypothetical protein